MLLDCVYILKHHPNLFLANFWRQNCVGNFTGLNLFEPELDLNLWSSPRFRHLPEPNHRSSSRFTEILKELDWTGLQQHYLGCRFFFFFPLLLTIFAHLCLLGHTWESMLSTSLLIMFYSLEASFCTFGYFWIFIPRFLKINKLA